jgi:Putative Ig domain/Glycine rich protein
MGNYNQYKNVNTIFGGVGAIQLPSGNATTQRPGGAASDVAALAAGQMRFNTITNRVEQYTGTSWLTLDAPPLLLSVTPNQIQPSEEGVSGTLLTLAGSNFSNDATVTLNGGTYNAITITSATGNSITCRIPTGVPINIYNIAVVNGSGLSSTLTSGFTVDTSPTWSTPAGSLGTVTNGSAITTIPLSATDPDGNATITYAVTANALPTGLSLSSGGNITGTPTGYVAGQTVSFTVTATSTQNASGSVATTPRNFTITVNLPITVTSLSTTSGNAGSSFTINGSNFSGTPAVTIGGVAASVSSVTSTSLVATVPVTVPVNYVVGKPTLSGGSNWFDSSSDYFGVDPSQRFQNGVKYTSVTWRLPASQASAVNYWWPHIVSKTGINTYTTLFAAKILCPVGTNGDVVTVQFSTAATKYGFDGDGTGVTIPATGDYFLAWRSGNGGTNNPGGSLWADNTNEAFGCVQYWRTDTLVSGVGYAYTASSSINATSGLMHIQFNAKGHDVVVSNAAITTNSVTQTPPAITAGQTFTRTFNTSVFGYTGANQTFSVPTGITKIEAKIWGAGGGGGAQGSWANGSSAAAGGFTFSGITVTPGESLIVVVGYAGIPAPKPIGNQYGGAGAGGSNSDNRYSGTGGGMSGVFRTTYNQAGALAIAGGGGGGGSSRNGNTCRGGAGGGKSGSNGSAGQGTAGQGGTQSAGGGGGSYGNSGSAMLGGNDPTNTYGGSGGGGYFGGGSGGYAEPSGMNGGGGGSGYIASDNYGQTVTSTDPATGANPRNYTDPDWGNGAGVGGLGATETGGTTSGGPGRVVIRY